MDGYDLQENKFKRLFLFTKPLTAVQDQGDQQIESKRKCAASFTYIKDMQNMLTCFH